MLESKINPGDYVGVGGGKHSVYKVCSISLINNKPVLSLRKLIPNQKKLSASVWKSPPTPFRKVEPPNYEPRVLKHHIYLLFNPDANEYKIGKTTDPDRRLREHGADCPNIKMIMCIEAIPEIEKVLIDRYAQKRVRGREWFNLDQTDVESIKKHLISIQ